MRLPVREPVRLPQEQHCVHAHRYLRRNFALLNGINQCFETSERLIPNPRSHFDVEFRLLGKIDQAGGILSQNFSADSGKRELYLYSQEGKFRLFVGGKLIATTVLVTRGRWRVFYDGTAIVFFKNGKQVYLRDFEAGSSVESKATFVIGGRHSDSLNSYAFAYTGVIADVIVRDFSGATKAFYRLQDADEVQRNYAEALGNNLSTVGPNYDSHPSGGDPLKTYPVADLKQGTKYLVECDIDEYSGSGTVGFVSGNGLPNPGNSRSSNGKLRFLFVAAKDYTLQLFSRNNSQCVFKNVSVQKAPGFCFLANPMASTWREYVRQWDDEWFSENLSQYKECKLPADWIDDKDGRDVHYWNLNNAVDGEEYLVAADKPNPSDGDHIGAGWSTSSGMPAQWRIARAVKRRIGGRYIAAGIEPSELRQRLFWSAPPDNAVLENVSIIHVMQET